MNEYTFLFSHSFRSSHVKAKTLYEAWQKTKRWFKKLTKEDQERLGEITTSFQWCHEEDYVLSGWLQSHNKRIIKEAKKINKAVLNGTN